MATGYTQVAGTDGDSTKQLDFYENSQNGTSDSLDDSSVDFIDGPITTCGYTPSCKPSWLQRFASPKAYLVIISLVTVVQGFAVNGINNVNITTYERRYLLSSKNSGFVASMYDVAAGSTVLFVGYFGARAHQPKILGFATLSLALGTFVMSLAHFAAPPYEPLSKSDTCLMQGNAVANATTNCVGGESQAFLKNYLYILLLGQALNGFAGTCLYSIGVTYLDESVSTKMSPLYLGIMTGCAALGPAIGYILGGNLLNFYVDAGLDIPNGLTVDDPSWVGAWWIGFVISAVLALILALFVFCFPKELPGTKAVRAVKVSQCHDNGTEARVNMSNFGISIKDFPTAAWYLLKNPAYMCITGVIGVELIILSGFSTFLPKFIVNQFSQPSSWSAILVGFLAVPGAAIGQLLGGYVCKRFQLKVRGIILLSLGLSVIVLLVIPVFWARCADGTLAGVLADYPGAPSSIGNLTAKCNADCGCTTELYNPVCADGVEYFSPCHAGCSSDRSSDVDGNLIFYNCSCPASASAGTLASNATVTGGRCPVACTVMLYGIFVPVTFIVLLATFMMGTPLTVATLRVVPEKQRAFAVSLQWVFLRFLGSIPGPLLFGAIIDSSCTIWEEDCDGTEGSCWVYNNLEMSKRLFILAVLLKLVSIAFNIGAHFAYKAPKTAEAIEIKPVETSESALTRMTST